MTKTGSGPDVLIVGGGPAGLTAALLLGRYGVPSVLVERRATLSALPRATGINLRSMEIFRAIGLADRISAASMDVRGLPLWVQLDSLRGPVRASHNLDVPSGAPDIGFPSPAAHLQLAQDRLEPILLEAVRSQSVCDVRFNTELLSVEEDEEGVTAALADLEDGRRHELRVDYVLGCDGAGSRVRMALGLAMSGQESMARELNILFEADLSTLVASHRAVLYRVGNAEMEGIFRPVDESGRWILTTRSFDGITTERCVELVRAGCGDCGEEPKILGFQEWVLGAATADHFQTRRVFLLGDAAHRTTPAGALGMNTAIHDAHNLAWKVAAVEQGWAGERLLDSYEPERRPVALRNVAASLDMWNDMSRAGRMLGAVLGFRYESKAVIRDGPAERVVADPVADFVPSASPGSRAPHAWLDLDGRGVSTLDLFDGPFVLLSPSAEWCSAANAITAELGGIPITSHRITDAGWRDLYGVGVAGAVLVRPDGHVGWRMAGESSRMQADIVSALSSILALSSQSSPAVSLSSRG